MEEKLLQIREFTLKNQQLTNLSANQTEACDANLFTLKFLGDPRAKWEKYAKRVK